MTVEILLAVVIWMALGVWAWWLWFRYDIQDMLASKPWYSQLGYGILLGCCLMVGLIAGPVSFVVFVD